jgi:hypothetical protein
MSLKKIIRKNIEDSAVTEPKIANEAVTAEKLGTDFITGLDELTSVAEDDNLMIFDTSAGVLKKVSKSNTTSLTSPTFSSVSPDNSQTADGGNITFTITGSGFTAGTNARLIGASGQRLNFTSVTRTSTTSITATIARSSLLQAQSPYGIQVINGEGLAVTTASLITIDNIPIFNTAAGSLGTFTEGDSIDIEVSAYDPDSTSGITYELQSGSLPAGLSLVNESGDSCRIQGTASAVDADTTSNFTLRATDSASNTTSRAFSITIEDFSMNGLRFDGASSDYLSQTLPNNDASIDKWTYSGWIKKNSNGVETYMFHFWQDGSNRGGLRFNSDDTLFYYDRIGGTDNVRLKTNAVFRDPSAWYHILVKVDKSIATPNTQIYVNGVEQSLAEDSDYTQGEDVKINEAITLYINNYDGSQNIRTIMMSEVFWISGQALEPTSFGETDSNGVWIPKAYSGTFGDNGFHLDFADSADLGNDVSGNDNDFTENNITSIDKVEDTPQNNYATLNPLNYTSSTITYSQGNTFATFPGAWMASLPTIGLTSGKWYWEAKINSGNNNNMFYGIAREGIDLDTTPYTQTGVISQLINGDRYIDGSYSASAAEALVNGDILGVALDLDSATKTVKFYKNGTLLSSSSSIDLTSNFDDYIVFPIFIGNNSSATAEWQVNFGNPAFTISSGNSDANGYGNFEYAVPSGYFALNTKNLAEYG